MTKMSVSIKSDQILVDMGTPAGSDIENMSKTKKAQKVIGCQTNFETKDKGTQTCRIVLLSGVLNTDSMTSLRSMHSKGPKGKKKKSTSPSSKNGNIEGKQKGTEKRPKEQSSLQASPSKHGLIESTTKSQRKVPGIPPDSVGTTGIALLSQKKTPPQLEATTKAKPTHQLRREGENLISDKTSKLTVQFDDLRLSLNQSKPDERSILKLKLSDRACSSSGEDSSISGDRPSNQRSSRQVDADRQSRIIYLTNRDRYERKADLLINAVPFRMPNS